MFLLEISLQQSSSLNPPVCCNNFKEEAKCGKRVFSIWYIWTERQVTRSEEKKLQTKFRHFNFRLGKLQEYLDLSRSVVELMKSVSLQIFPKGYPYIISGCDTWQK